MQKVFADRSGWKASPSRDIQMSMDDAKKSEAPSFEESLAKLEQIARDLEEGDLGLDAALARYQEGVGRLRDCRKMLETAERKIELLLGVTDSGEAITAPFDDGPTDAASIVAESDSPKSRAKRRTAPRAKNVAPIDHAEIAPPEVAPQVAPQVDVDSPKRLF